MLETNSLSKEAQILLLEVLTKNNSELNFVTLLTMVFFFITIASFAYATAFQKRITLVVCCSVVFLASAYHSQNINKTLLAQYDTVRTDFISISQSPSQRISDVKYRIEQVINAKDIQDATALIERLRFCYLNDIAVLRAEDEKETFLCVRDDTRSNANGQGKTLSEQLSMLNRKEVLYYQRLYKRLSLGFPSEEITSHNKESENNPNEKDAGGKFYKILSQ